MKSKRAKMSVFKRNSLRKILISMDWKKAYDKKAKEKIEKLVVIE